MEFRDYIEQGINKMGTAVELGKFLGQSATVISNAKAHQRGLPLAACYKLAELIGAPRDAVAASSALVTEKDESIRKYLRPFADVGGIAASYAAVFFFAVTLIVTSTPSEASPLLTSSASTLCIMLNCWLFFKEEIAIVKRKLSTSVQHFCFSS